MQYSVLDLPQAVRWATTSGRSTMTDTEMQRQDWLRSNLKKRYGRVEPMRLIGVEAGVAPPKIVLKDNQEGSACPE